MLSDLGGLSRPDQIRLEDPTPEELNRGFSRMARMIRDAVAAGETVQFIFYYSGHSDEQGLRLGETVLVTYKDLRKKVDKVPLRCSHRDPRLVRIGVVHPAQGRKQDGAVFGRGP